MLVSVVWEVNEKVRNGNKVNCMGKGGVEMGANCSGTGVSGWKQNTRGKGIGELYHRRYRSGPMVEKPQGRRRLGERQYDWYIASVRLA